MPDHPPSNFSDHFCLWQMDLLTLVCKRILPGGHWIGRPPQASDEEGGTGEAKPKLYLTFDDGPCPETTPYLIELLEKENAHATFFLMGARAKRHPKLVEMIAKAGHAIGNHTYNHLFMPILTTRFAESEIEATNKSIEDATGKSPHLFRPPYGVVDQRTADLIKEREMATVYWSAVSGDWSTIGADRVVARLTRRFTDGSLIVLHEGESIRRQTVEATRELLQIGKRRGFEFKPIARG